VYLWTRTGGDPVWIRGAVVLSWLHRTRMHWVRVGHPRQSLGWPLYLALSVCVLYATPTLLRLTWQLTPSEPQGLYRLRSLPQTLSPGMFVTLPVPATVANLIYTHHWLPPGVPLLKAVAAIEGDTVCIQDDGVWINGTWQAPVFRELGGVALPVLRSCWTLGANEVFLLSTTIPNSMDGRYFGVLSHRDLSSIAVPLVTWE
jgi:conjugative transfer signal peptidase TraF